MNCLPVSHSRERLYRVALTLLTVALIAVSFAYVHEHELLLVQCQVTQSAQSSVVQRGEDTRAAEERLQQAQAQGEDWRVRLEKITAKHETLRKETIALRVRLRKIENGKITR